MTRKISVFALLACSTTLFAASSASAAPAYHICVSRSGSVSYRATAGCPRRSQDITAILHGLDGAAGAPGAAGAAGATGAAGPQGAMGAGGAVGPVGPQGSAGLAGGAGPAGAPGSAGTPGADGTVKIYGSGEDGDVTISAPTTFDASKQYANITIDSGVTVTVEAGTRIRCTGSFVNNGTIQVRSLANGGYVYPPASGTLYAPAASARAGFGASSSDNGQIVNAAQPALGGFGAITRNLYTTVTDVQAKALIFPPTEAGGGGGGAAESGLAGGNGGGLVVVRCLGSITIGQNGVVNADGADAGSPLGGGGAGGAILLASKTSITNSGTLSARGAQGDPADVNGAGGGGGGGGIIALAAPVVNNAGTALIDGGAGAAAAPSIVSSTTRQGGGGGGACGGSGGNGGSVTSFDASAGSSGESGLVLRIVADPTSLLF